MRSTSLIPFNSPLRKILEDWSTYSYKPMTKKRTKFYHNFIWSMYVLEHEERWSLNGSLNYYFILQLELFCYRNRKERFHMQLHNKESEQLGNRQMVHRGKKVILS